MRRLQVLILALSVIMASLAAAGSLDLYRRPGIYQIKGTLTAAKDRRLTLNVFGRTRNRVTLRLDFSKAPDLALHAATLINEKIVASGYVDVKAGVIRPTSLARRTEAPPLDPAEGDGFWPAQRAPKDP